MYIVWYSSGYMRGLGITPKQRRYAFNIMNSDTTKKQALLDAGYSETTADHPNKIEQSDGFKLALAKQAFDAGNIASGLMNEIQVRGYKDYDTKTLFFALDTIGKAFERFAPKSMKESDQSMKSVFSSVIDVTPLQNKDETTETIDNTPEVLHDTE